MESQVSSFAAQKNISAAKQVAWDLLKKKNIKVYGSPKMVNWSENMFFTTFF